MSYVRGAMLDTSIKDGLEERILLASISYRSS
jgi:hypothetical protein